MVLGINLVIHLPSGDGAAPVVWCRPRLRRCGHIPLAQISNGRRYDFRGSHGSGLAAVHVRVDRQIVVGLQARQVRVANACVFHKVIDATGERHVDGPSTRGVLVAFFDRSRGALGSSSDRPPVVYGSSSGTGHQAQTYHGEESNGEHSVFVVLGSLARAADVRFRVLLSRHQSRVVSAAHDCFERFHSHVVSLQTKILVRDECDIIFEK